MLADEEDGIVPARRRKSKWHRVTYFPSEQLDCLSLKEHSPPIIFKIHLLAVLDF
jgi:hypothetical protein